MRVSAQFRGGGRVTLAHGAHPEPPHTDTGIVLTAVAELGCWRWSDFQEDVVRLRAAGHVIDVEEIPGVFERRVAVTAEIGILNLLPGEPPQS